MAPSPFTNKNGKMFVRRKDRRGDDILSDTNQHQMGSMHQKGYFVRHFYLLGFDFVRYFNREGGQPIKSAINWMQVLRAINWMQELRAINV